MKSAAVLASVVIVIGAAVACGQSGAVYPAGGNNYNDGYPTYHHASTAAEGGLRGMADVVRSAGQANLDNSAAAINYSVARNNQIKNQREWTNTYLDMRQTNKAYQDANRRPKATMEQRIRMAQIDKPKPLSPGEVDVVTGEIQWQRLLLSDTFAEQRNEVNQAFAERASNSVLGPDDYLGVRNTIKAMLASLEEQIRNVPQMEYVAAKRFLQSLAVEAGTPAG